MGHYWTGYFTSRPNFKKLIRDYTAQTQSDDTFFGLEYLQKAYKKNQTDITLFNMTHAKTIKLMNELVATSTHHDTITGTSPSYVITNETSTFWE